MFKNWFAQGIVTNLVTAALIAAGGIMVASLARLGSPWASPALYGLGASALLTVIVAAVRTGGLFRSQRMVATPANARYVIRDWLDKAGTTVQNSPIASFVFNYIVTINGRKISIGQEIEKQSYLTLSASLVFTDEDNRTLESAQGGREAVTKGMKIALAAVKMSYTGIGVPLQKVVVAKSAFIGDGLLEHEVMAAMFDVEAAFNLVLEIATVPRSEPPKQSSQSVP